MNESLSCYEGCVNSNFLAIESLCDEALNKYVLWMLVFRPRWLRATASIRSYFEFECHDYILMLGV